MDQYKNMQCLETQKNVCDLFQSEQTSKIYFAKKNLADQ